LISIPNKGLVKFGTGGERGYWDCGGLRNPEAGNVIEDGYTIRWAQFSIIMLVLRTLSRVQNKYLFQSNVIMVCFMLFFFCGNPDMRFLPPPVSTRGIGFE
jgi:hypothetical protein